MNREEKALLEELGPRAFAALLEENQGRLVSPYSYSLKLRFARRRRVITLRCAIAGIY